MIFSIVDNMFNLEFAATTNSNEPPTDKKNHMNYSLMGLIGSLLFQQLSYRNHWNVASLISLLGVYTSSYSLIVYTYLRMKPYFDKLTYHQGQPTVEESSVSEDAEEEDYSDMPGLITLDDDEEDYSDMPGLITLDEGKEDYSDMYASNSFHILDIDQRNRIKATSIKKRDSEIVYKQLQKVVDDTNRRNMARFLAMNRYKHMQHYQYNSLCGVYDDTPSVRRSLRLATKSNEYK